MDPNPICVGGFKYPENTLYCGFYKAYYPGFPESLYIDLLIFFLRWNRYGE